MPTTSGGAASTKLMKIGTMSVGLCSPCFAESAQAPVKRPKKIAPAMGCGLSNAEMAPATPATTERITARRSP